MAIPDLNDVTAIAAGYKHTCALVTGGTLLCWGDNSSHQLGNDNWTNRTDVLIPPFDFRGAAAVAAGYLHTCALMIDGTMQCWGANDAGQIGSNAPINYSWRPVAIPDVSQVIAISAGDRHTCAVLANGTAMCWGFNGDGELGDGTTTNSRTPVVVSDLNGVTDISASNGYTCALLMDGTVKCWGRNVNGQLGNGTTTDSSTPVAVWGLTGATALSPGSSGDHMCAILAGGTIKCWGDNSQSQLGNGGPIEYLTPVAVKL